MNVIGGTVFFVALLLLVLCAVGEFGDIGQKVFIGVLLLIGWGITVLYFSDESAKH